MSGSRVVLDPLEGADIRSGGRVLDAGRWTDIARLPFADASFDIVVCRQRLQLCPDRGLALSEMCRVLVDGGRAMISVGGPIERSPVFAALADALERHAGVRAAATVHWLFSLSEPEDLQASLACAGFTDIRVGTASQTTILPSIAELLRFVPRSRVDTSPGGLSDRARRKVVADLNRELVPWIGATGLQLTMEVNTAIATR